jgi:hypothetical protein
VVVAYAEPCPLAQRQELVLKLADVCDTGFMPRIVLNQQRPMFDYGRRVPLADARDPAGYYTAFGSAVELVQEADSAVAIFGPGEEMHFEFAAPSVACRDGWSRRFVIEAIGACKDMDFYTGDGATVGPLPRCGSPDTRRESLHKKYNTRYQHGR